VELNEKRAKMDDIQAHLDRALKKIQKYKQRKKRVLEPIIYTEWPQLYNSLNEQLVLWKKDKFTDQEINKVPIIAHILQSLVTMSQSQIIYIFGRLRTMPEEVIKELESSKEMLKAIEAAKNTLEQQNQELSKQFNALNNQVQLLEGDNTRLKDQVNSPSNKQQEDASKQMVAVEADSGSVMIRMKQLNKQTKEEKHAKDDNKKEPKVSKKLKAALFAEKQHQNIHEHLLDELKTTTTLLNDTLVEKK